MKCFDYIFNQCCFCEKYKFKLYEIPIYNDFHHLSCSMTFESYIACRNCIIKLLQNRNIVISLKSVVKESVCQYIINSGQPHRSPENVLDLQKTLRNEREYQGSVDYLSKEDNDVIKEIIKKINLKYMC